jgi:hypothetical protein
MGPTAPCKTFPELPRISAVSAYQGTAVELEKFTWSKGPLGLFRVRLDKRITPNLLRVLQNPRGRADNSGLLPNGRHGMTGLLLLNGGAKLKLTETNPIASNWAGMAPSISA